MHAASSLGCGVTPVQLGVASVVRVTAQTAHVVLYSYELCILLSYRYGYADANPTGVQQAGQLYSRWWFRREIRDRIDFESRSLRSFVPLAHLISGYSIKCFDVILGIFVEFVLTAHEQISDRRLACRHGQR